MENLDPYLYLANVVQVATFMCECDLLAEDAVSSSARETALRVGGLAQVLSEDDGTSVVPLRDKDVAILQDFGTVGEIYFTC